MLKSRKLYNNLIPTHTHHKYHDILLTVSTLLILQKLCYCLATLSSDLSNTYLTKKGAYLFNICRNHREIVMIFIFYFFDCSYFLIALIVSVVCSSYTSTKHYTLYVFTSFATDKFYKLNLRCSLMLAPCMSIHIHLTSKLEYVVQFLLTNML